MFNRKAKKIKPKKHVEISRQPFTKFGTWYKKRSYMVLDNTPGFVWDIEPWFAVAGIVLTIGNLVAIVDTKKMCYNIRTKVRQHFECPR